MMVNGPLRWVVGPVVLSAVAILVVILSSYALVGGPPRFLGGASVATTTSRPAPMRMEGRGGEVRGPRGDFREMEAGGLGGVGRMLGKSLLLMGIPGALALGASWALFRRTGSTPESTDFGRAPSAT